MRLTGDTMDDMKVLVTKARCLAFPDGAYSSTVTEEAGFK